MACKLLSKDIIIKMYELKVMRAQNSSSSVSKQRELEAQAIQQDRVRELFMYRLST